MRFEGAVFQVTICNDGKVMVGFLCPKLGKTKANESIGLGMPCSAFKPSENICL